MDLGTMKVKIENKGYTSHLDFATDMRLVFTNCYKYNPPDHEIGQAHHMFSRFLNLRILFTKFSLSCFPTRSVFYWDKKWQFNFLWFQKKDTLQPSKMWNIKFVKRICRLIACKSASARLLLSLFSVNNITEKWWLVVAFNGSKIGSIHTLTCFQKTKTIRPDVS